MKQTAWFLIVLLLASCAPAQPAAPSQPPATATVILPTATSVVVESTATALLPTETLSPTRVDFDYAIIPGSETVTDIDGYPVSIAVHPSMSSKFRDIEFSDMKPILDVILDKYYREWLGHKLEARGKTFAEFMDLRARAMGGDQEALEAITYETWLNDFDDDKGYKPLLVKVRPLIGGGWTADGVLQPDETRLVVVDTRKVNNISPQSAKNSRKE